MPLNTILLLLYLLLVILIFWNNSYRCLIISTNLGHRCWLFSPGLPVGSNGITYPGSGFLDVVAVHHSLIKVIVNVIYYPCIL